MPINKGSGSNNGGSSSNISINGKTGSSITLVKSDIGLTNVPNVDTTNASNISTGIIDSERLPVSTQITMGCSKIGNGINVDNEGLITTKLGIGLKYDGIYNIIPDVVNIDVTQLKNFSAIVTGSPKGFFNNTATLATFADGSKGDFWIFNGTNGFSLGGNTFNTGDQLWIINTFSGNPVNLTANHVYVANTLSQATTTTFGTVKLGNITPLADSSTPAIGTSVATAREDHVHPILPDVTATVSGKVPTPPNNTTTFFRGDATFAEIPVMGASGASHGAGLVPDTSSTAGTTKFLREDATWVEIDNGGGLTPVIKNESFAIEVNKLFFVDTTGASAITVTLPLTANLNIGDTFRVVDYLGNSSNRNITIDFISAGQKLESADDNFVCNDNFSHFEFTWSGAIRGWSITPIGMVSANSTDAGIIQMYGGSIAPSGWMFCNGNTISRTTYARLFSVIGTTYGSGDGVNSFGLPDMRNRFPLGSGQSTFVSTFANTAVNISTDVITVPSNNSLYTGLAVVLTTSGTVPGGLVTGSTYYVIKISTTSIKLSSSLINAVAGTAINLTSQGTGTHSLTTTYTNRVLGSVGGREEASLTINEIPAHNHTYDDTYSVQWSSEAFGTPLSSTDEINRIETSSSTGGSQAHSIMNPFISINYIIKY